MAVFRFPCWICGVATDGVDSYVVCADCMAELDVLPNVPSVDDEAAQSCPHDRVGTAPSQEEIDARIRKLLDDW